MPTPTKQPQMPPIRPVWLIAAAIATIVLLLLTARQVLTPPQSPQPATSQSPERIGSDMVDEKPPSSLTPVKADQGRAENPPDREDTDRNEPEAAKVKDKKTEQQEEAKLAEPASAKEAKSQSAETEQARRQPSAADAAHVAEKRAEDPNASIAEQLQAKAQQNATDHPEEQVQPKNVGTEVAAEDQRRWLMAAREFATTHQGRVLEARPFSGGTLRWSPGIDAQLAEFPFWFLGGGWLETAAGVYTFGPKYQSAPPVLRQEIPQLAEKLGLASAAIEARPSGNDVMLVATATPKPIGPDVLAPKRAEIMKLENRLQRLKYQIIEWDRLEEVADSAESRDKRNAIRAAILDILDMQEPPLYSADRLAREKVVSLARQIQDLQDESKALLARLNDDNDRAVQRFKNGCRRLTVVVYRSEPAQPNPAEQLPQKLPAEPPPQKPSPAARPSGTTESQSVTPADLKPTNGVAQWAVDYRAAISKDAFTASNTEMAELTVQVVSASGSLLPKWFRDEFRVNCTIWEYPADGRPRSRELTGAAKPKTYNITEGTAQIAVRFWFLRKSALPGEGVRPTAETPWHIIDGVQQGAEYQLKAPISSESFSSLQSKPEKPKTKSTKPGSGKKP